MLDQVCEANRSTQEETFYTQQHQHDCGIDLHARTMYPCIRNQTGEVLLHRNLGATTEAFLPRSPRTGKSSSSPPECMFTWLLARRSLRRRSHPVRPSGTPSV